MQAVLQTALQHHQAGFLAEAEQYYKQVLAAEPENADALHLFGVLARQVHRPDIAVDLIQKAIVLRKDVPAFYNNLGTALQDQGKLAEALAAYKRALTIRPDYAEAHINMGNAFRAQNEFGQAVRHFRHAIALNPHMPEVYNNLGAIQKAAGHLEDALLSYQQALTLKPDYIEAHINKGHALKELSKNEEAIKCYEQALALNSDSAEAHNGIGRVLKADGRLDEAVQHYEQAIAIKTNYAEARANLSNALRDQGKLDESITAAEKALAIDPHSAEAHFNLAFTQLLQGNFDSGWRDYEWRQKLEGVRFRSFTSPVWDGGPLAGKTILIVCEQGLGDNIQFIRYAALLKEKSARVLVYGPASLVPLFRGVAGVDDMIPDDQPPPEHDVHAHILSLPGLCGTRLDTIPASVPYLHPDAELTSAWREKLSGCAGRKVGIVWRGNPAHKNDRNRSMSPTDFAAFLDVPGIAVINLQKDARFEEIAALNVKGEFLNPAAELHSFNDTAALMATLDLVIAVDTSLCHLAGGLGVPVWTLLPFAPDWRWMMGRTDSPWYPGMRLFRQTRTGDWPGVIEKIRAALQGLT